LTDLFLLEVWVTVLKERKLNILSIMLLASLAGLSGCASQESFIRTPSMLAPQGIFASRIAGLSWFMIILGSLIFIGVMAYAAYAIWGNRGYELEEELARPNEGSGIVLTWGVGFTAVVLVVLFGLNLWTMRANNLTADGGEGLVIDVIGRQWWWEIQYTQQGFETANEIRIPVGQPVTLRLTTKDVIHSIWVPELNGKMDLVPGKVTELTLLADQPGEYWGECAEFCGTQHAKMKLMVIAQTEEQFAAWLESQQEVPPPPEDELAIGGQQVFLGSACVYCHNIEGTNASGDLGPDLTHLGSRRTLGAGILDYSLGNVGLWVLDSHRYKPGNLMPAMDLTEEELSQLLAYLRTLE
jgi:cytochrome c oxidase subunit II